MWASMGRAPFSSPLAERHSDRLATGRDPDSSGNAQRRAVALVRGPNTVPGAAAALPSLCPTKSPRGVRRVFQRVRAQNRGSSTV